MKSPQDIPFQFTAESRLEGRAWKREGHGTATLRTKSGDLWIEEAGQWSDTQDNATLQGALFEKRLVFRTSGEGSIDILKPDLEGELQLLVQVYPQKSGRSWKSLDPHVCAQDLYSASLELDHEDELRVTWTATGPQKNYTTLSCYPGASLFSSWLAS